MPNTPLSPQPYNPILPTTATNPQTKPALLPTMPGNTGIVPQGYSATGQPTTTQTLGSPPPMPTMPQNELGNSTQIGNVNGIDPVRVNPTGMGGYQPFIDSAYQQATSRLDPQFEQADRRFQQQMVNQGLTAGTEAYDNARANFDRSRNDAYAGARNDAMGQGLAAQNQGFNQGAQQTGLAQGMRQWNDQYGLNREAADLGAYGTLAGIDMAQFGLNQNADQQAFNQRMAMLGMIPGMAPSNVDVNGAYGLGQSSSQFNAQQSANANNGMWNAVGQIGAAYLSDRTQKETIEAVDVDHVLGVMTNLSLDMWKYIGKEDQDEHIGTYSQEFNQGLGLPDKPEIALVDMMGALHACIIALNRKLNDAAA